MVGGTDGDAADFWHEFQWESRRQLTTGLGGTRAREHPLDVRNLFVRKFLQVLTIWVFCAVVCAQGAEPSAKRGSNAAPALEAAAAQATGLGADQVKACQKLYLNKCMRCHKSYEPSGYSQTEWESW